MKEDLKKLYTQIIKAHNEEPFHFAKIENASTTIKSYNPICGDRFHFFVESDSEKISEIHFHGFGCAISKASGSVMSQFLKGKTFEEARSICNNFLNFVDKKLNLDDFLLPQEFLAFSGVHDFPERYDCATLAWREMRIFLNKLN